MTRPEKPSMQVEIVDPSEVSQIIQLEPSVAPIPRTSGPARFDPIPQRRSGASPTTTGPRSPARSTGAPPAAAPEKVEKAEAPLPAAPVRAAAPPRDSDAEPSPPVSPPKPSPSPNETSTPAVRSVAQSATPPTASADATAAPPRPTSTSSSGAHSPAPAVDVSERQSRASASTASVPTPFARTPVLNERLLARKLAAGVDAAIRESQTRTVLITSPTEGTGKSFVTSIVAEEFETIAPGRYAVLDYRELAEFDPTDRPEELLVLVDGPSMLEGDGLLNMPQRWLREFDGAIVVVLGRDTRSDHLEETVKWLENSRIKVVGLIFNELYSPDPSLRLRIWWRYLRSGTVKKDIIDVIRTFGGSLRRRR